MPREIVTGDTLADFVEKKMAKKPVDKPEEYKAKTPAEKSRFFDKIKNQYGLLSTSMKPQLERIKREFMAGKIDEMEVKEKLKAINSPVKAKEEKAETPADEMAEKKDSSNLLADIANKKM